MTATKVLIIDSNSAFRESLTGFLEAQGGMKIIGPATSGQMGLALADLLGPDVVLIDLAIPDLPNLTAIPMIRDVAPEVVIIPLSTIPANAEAYRAAVVGAGADDYVPKCEATTELIPAIQRAIAKRGRTNSS